jgi:3-phenylpropionate/trans-cinnamate dioxygenase ferredoxin reductase subunit
MFTDLHREHGVRLLLGDSVEEIKGSGGKVSTVLAKSGETVDADVVVVGIGARPNVELAEDAKLDVDNGVLVDAALQASHPDVFAAGDIANAFNPLFGRRIRVEHWANALNSGPAAARSMLGQSVSYDRVPYFFTDQYDLGMEYTGDIGPDGYDSVVYRGDPSTREVIAFWTKDGRVLAGMNVNVWDVTDDVQALIKSKEPVDPARLADKNIPLSDLVND